MRAARHADHVSGLDLDGEDRPVLRVDVEDPASPTMNRTSSSSCQCSGVNLREHRVEARRRRRHVDDVRRDVAAARFELVDLHLYAARTSAAGAPGGNGPRLGPLVVDAEAAGTAGIRGFGDGAIFVGNSNERHTPLFSSSA